jgi:hypothetical protein
MPKMRIRQSALVAVALLTLVAAAGCSGAAGQDGDDTALQADRARSGGQASGRPGGAGQAPGSPGADGAPRAPGAPGAPGPGGPDENAQAPGSPITIPPFQQIGGQPVDKVRLEIEEAIRKACTPRHDLCVKTVLSPATGSKAHLCFGGTEPHTYPDSAELDRGEVLTIKSIEGACELPETNGESSSSSIESSETTQSSSDSTETSESSQAPPFSDTETSETSQSAAVPPPSTS